MTEPSLIQEDRLEEVWASLDETGFTKHGNLPATVPKHMSDSTQTKGRRSWFDNPPTTKLDISTDASLQKSQQECRKEDMEVLTLTHFTNPPRIDFGKIKPCVTRRRHLLVSNPHEYDQHVVVERVPSKKHFSVEQNEFVVAAEKSFVLTIVWRPEEEGHYREMFLFLIDGVYRLQTIVFGNVQAPPQRRRERKGLLGSRVKKPFSVLHTQNLVNINQSYTPKRASIKDNVVLTGFTRQESKSHVENENIAPNSSEEFFRRENAAVESSMDSDAPKTSSSNEPEQNGAFTQNRKSVRKSTTYTKIDMDTADSTMLENGSTVSSNLTSDTNAMASYQPSTATLSDTNAMASYQPSTATLSDTNAMASYQPSTATLTDTNAMESYQPSTATLSDTNAMESYQPSTATLSDANAMASYQPSTATLTDTNAMASYQPSTATLSDTNAMASYQPSTATLTDTNAMASYQPSTATLSDTNAMASYQPSTATLYDANAMASYQPSTATLSDTNAMASYQPSTATLSEAPIKKLDFNSTQTISRSAFSPNTPKGIRQPLNHSYVSPNTFLKENLASSTPTNFPKLAEDVFAGSSLPRSPVNYNPKSKAADETDKGFAMADKGSFVLHGTLSMTPTTNRSLRQTSHVQVSPMSFLKESLSHTPDPGSVSVTSDKIPSPGMILNNSVPHEIMVRQLGSVRKSLSVCDTPPLHWEASPITKSPAFPIFIRAENKPGQKASTSRSAGVPKTKTRRRSRTRTKTSTQNLFQDIPNIPSPRRSTFLVKSKKAEKLSTSQRLRNASPKVMGKVRPSGKKPKSIPKSQLQDVQNCAFPVKTTLNFSPTHSTEAVLSPMSLPDNIDLARLTMVVKKPKVLVPNAKTNKTSPTKPSKKTIDSSTIVKKSKVDPSTVVKPKSTQSNVVNEDHISSEKSPRELFPKSPVKSVIEDVIDIGSPQPFPSSPNPDLSRRGTLTITKCKPSEHLLKSAGPGKSLFDPCTKSPHILNSTTIVEDVGTTFSVPSEDVGTTFSVPSEDVGTTFSVPSEDVGTTFSVPSEDVDLGTELIPLDSTVNLSLGLSKISQGYQSNPDNSSAEPSPELSKTRSLMNENVASDQILPSIDRKEVFIIMKREQIPEVPVKQSTQVLRSIDRGERFLSSEERCSEVKDTPVRPQVKPPGKAGVKLRRQLAQTNIKSSIAERVTQTNIKSSIAERVTQTNIKSSIAERVTQTNIKSSIAERVTQTNIISSIAERVTQKKRYLSDSSARISKADSVLLQDEKRQKVNTADVSKPRTRRATESSIKPGSKKERQRYHSKPCIAQNRLVLLKKGSTALPKHPMPFAAKNVYYDERWIEKQERGFVKWMNFILTPPEECQTKAEKISIDAGSLNLDPKSSVQHLAPTKEVLSLRAYAARRRMNRLRRAACRLYQSDEVVKIVQKVEAEVESFRLAVRKDRMVHADVGLKQKILDLILSYNSLWLRIGLETIYGEILPLQSNSDVIGLSRFVLTRLLGNPDVAIEFSHPTVPHLYKQGYQEAMSKHILKKFVILVYFLDLAKRRRLIDHDPCLFCKNAEWKSSKDLLFQLSKDYLSGEGDITRHLGFLGYTVSCTQIPLDEFDYAVTNLANDLRDGLRLMRVVELLTQTWNLCRRLRVPAVSRLQKIHNMEASFKALTEYSRITDPTDGGKVNSRDIVDGHREKTLSLLWNIILNFQVDVLIDEVKLRDEVSMLTQCLSVRKVWQKLYNQPNNAGPSSPEETDVLADVQICQKNSKLQLLLSWARAVCAFYNFKVENFTVSFSDGRAFCYLVHHYYPGLLPLSNIQSETSMMFHDKSPDLDDSFSSPLVQQINSDSDQVNLYEKYLHNERENFKVLYEKVSELGGVPLMLKSVDMSNTIPDERVVITYLSHLCSRLLDIQQEMKAARVIQMAWRRRQIQRQRQLKQKQTRAACCIQQRIREFLSKRSAGRHQAAAVRIQTMWRGYQSRKLLTQLIWEKENKEKLKAVRTLQWAVRGFLQRRHYVKLMKSVVIIQALARGVSVRQQVKSEKAARRIQEMYRGWKQTQQLQARLTALRKGACVLQRAFRLRRENNRRKQAAIQIQTTWRSFMQQRQFSELKKSAIFLQSCFRMVQARRQYLTLRHHTLVIQRRFRASVTMKSVKDRYIRMKDSAVLIQSVWRGTRQRNSYLKQRSAAVLLQSQFRSYKCRIKFRALRLATVIVQRQYRAQIAMRKCQLEYQDLLSKRLKAAVTIQRTFQGFVTRKTFLKQRHSAIIIQSAFRGFIARKSYRKIQHSVKLIQRLFKDYQLRCQRENIAKVKAATLVQSIWRKYAQRQNYLNYKRASIKIQSFYKIRLCRSKFLKIQQSIVTIQRGYRAYRLGQSVRLEMDVKIGAALTIQAVWKSYHAKRHYQITKESVLKIQQWWRARQQRIKFLGLQKCVITIQRHYRNRQKTLNAKSKYLNLRSAIVCLQRKWREKQAVNKCATVIQAKWKQYLARRTYLRKQQAALILQRWYRVHLTSKREKKLQLIKYRSAVIIQSIWRGHSQVKMYRKTQLAAIFIQSQCRCWQKRRHFLKLRAATQTIQRQWRAWNLGCKLRGDFVDKKNAALTLQSAFRGLKTRKAFLQKRQAAMVLQLRWRSILKHRKLLTSVILIQRGFRLRQAMLSKRREYMAKKNAVLTIQSAWRNHQKRKEAYEVQCAVRLQAAVRKYLCQKDYQQKRQACLCLQRQWKTYVCQQEYKKLKKAALCLQIRYRAVRAAHKQQLEYQTKRNSVIQLQALARGFLVRKKSKAKQNAAILIQSFWRMAHTRREYQRKREATIFIQRWYTNNKAAQLHYNHYNTLRISVIKLQAVYRAYNTRKEFELLKTSTIFLQARVRRCLQQQQFNRLKTKVVIIQRKVRAHQAMNHDRKLYLKKRCAAVCIQTAFRNMKQRKLRKVYKAAILIQTVYRGYKERKNFICKKSAATLIQSHYRRYCVQTSYQRQCWASLTIKRWWLSVKLAQTKKLQLQQQQEVEKRQMAAGKIQIWYRARKQAKCQRQKYLKIYSSVLRIQCYIRGYLTRKTVRRVKAARLIQKNFRRFQDRKSYLEIQKAAIVIQCFVRRVCAKNAFEKRKFAIQILQRNIRAYLFCSRVYRASQLRDKSARKLQTWYRSLKHEREIKRERAALVLQSYFRRFTHRLNYCKLRWAAIVIQRRFRHKQAVKTFHHLKQLYEEHRQCLVAEFILRGRRELSAVLIQRAYRRHHLLQVAKTHMLSVIKIQRWVRGRLDRIHFISAMNSVRIIQRCVRGWLKRRELAALTIQSAVRHWLYRKHLQRKLNAIITIQAGWRGYLTRRRNSRKVALMRQRLSEVNAAATDDKRLGHRTASALDYLLRYKQLAYILEALMHLEVVTRLSGECCITIVEGNAVGVIYTLIRSCNRSLPHMELIKYAVTILLNLAKFDRTIHAVYSAEDSISTLVDLMQIYRDKGIIFSKTCTLLGILALNHRRRQEMKDDMKLMERICSIYSLTARKQKIEDTRTVTKHKQLSSRTSFNSTLPTSTPSKRFPRVRPDWLLRRDSLKVFENPLCAINFVMESLQLTPK